MGYNGFNFGTLEFNTSLVPSASFPLDGRSLFSSYAEANVMAKSAVAPGVTGSNYYHGQIVTVIASDGITHYTIEANGTLTPVGAQTAGDDKTIKLNNGVLSLANFGERYYKYIAKDIIIEGEYAYPDNMPSSAANGAYVKVADVWYVLNSEGWAVADTEPNTTEHYELTEGWPANKGLTAQAVLNAAGNAYELAWYEPSTVTVEGLSQSISSMQTTVDAIDTKVTVAVSDLEQQLADEIARATGIEAGLRTDVDANKAAITKLNADASTEGSVDYKIAVALDAYLNADGDTSKIDTLKDLINWAEQHETSVASYGTDIAANKQAIAELEAKVGPLPEGTTAANVIAYIQELVKAEETRAMLAEAGLQTAIDNLAKIALTDASQFATAEQGAKADTAVQNVVAGETNGHIAVDGADVKVYELNPANVTTLGGIKPDGSSISVTEDGTASVAAVDYTKVTGLGAQLENAKNAAITAATEDAANNYIPKANIVADGAVAENVEAASDGLVISEKLFMNSMSWKTEM